MNSNTKPEAVLFDLDGTLIDSIGLIVECFQHVVFKHLGQKPKAEDILPLIGRPLTYELQRLSPEHAAEMQASYREHQFAIHDDRVKLFEGVPEMLASLLEQKIPLGIVTSKARRGTEKALTLFPCKGSSFKTIITVEDCDKHKPDPDPLLLAAKNLGVNPINCVYVGDSIYDMQAANKAGMKAVGVSWGVGTIAELSYYNTIVIESPEELLSQLYG